MFVVYVTCLVIGVYLVPGLALVPRAALDSRLAYAVPIVSVLVVTLLARVLKTFGVFSEPVVLFITLAFAATAAYRINRIWSKVEIHWPPAHRLVYSFSVCAGLFAAVRLGLSSFDVDDEIYSWNMWGIQHALGEPHDLFFTVAPYPQTFSYLIAWNYQRMRSMIGVVIPALDPPPTLPGFVGGNCSPDLGSPMKNSQATLRPAASE